MTRYKVQYSSDADWRGRWYDINPSLTFKKRGMAVVYKWKCEKRYPTLKWRIVDVEWT